MEYEKIDPKDVKVGDEVLLDGYGFYTDPKGARQWADCDLSVPAWFKVSSLSKADVSFIEIGNAYSFRRSSIVEARRKVEKPKVGEWRHFNADGKVCLSKGCVGGRPAEVYRSTGWSKDQRKNTGPLVIRPGVYVTITDSFEGFVHDISDEGTPCWSRDLKNLNAPVQMTPIERRKS